MFLILFLIAKLPRQHTVGREAKRPRVILITVQFFLFSFFHDFSWLDRKIKLLPRCPRHPSAVLASSRRRREPPPPDILFCPRCFGWLAGWLPLKHFPSLRPKFINHSRVRQLRQPRQHMEGVTYVRKYIRTYMQYCQVVGLDTPFPRCVSQRLAQGGVEKYENTVISMLQYAPPSGPARSPVPGKLPSRRRL